MDQANQSSTSTVSIVILTMNRSLHMQNVLKNIAQQSYLPSEIIIVDNNSELKEQKNNEKLAKKYNAEYFLMNKNLGVSGGRNYGLKRANGDIIIEIDDDAEFVSRTSIEKVVEYFQEDRLIGVLAFSIYKNKNFNVRREEFPFFQKKKNITNELTPCGWFIGAGHAFKKDIFNKVNYYNDFFPYGQEEIDFSIRVIDAGYKILFAKNIKIFHFKTDDARFITPINIAGLNLKNRIKVALLNLNIISIIFFILIRGFQYLIRYRTIKVIVIAWELLKKDLNYIKSNRKVVSCNTYVRLIRVRGPILF